MISSIYEYLLSTALELCLTVIYRLIGMSNNLIQQLIWNVVFCVLFLEQGISFPKGTFMNNSYMSLLHKFTELFMRKTLLWGCYVVASVFPRTWDMLRSCPSSSTSSVGKLGHIIQSLQAPVSLFSIAGT